jgi:hypothetical protein
MKKKIIIVILVVFVSGISYAYYLFNKKHVSVSEVKPAFTMDAHLLVSEYDSNEKTANSKYLGKVIEVQGVVAEKMKDQKGNYNVTLQGPDISGIGCEFEPAAQNYVMQIKEGQKVTIKGVCTGVLMDVVMVDCCIIPESEKSNN